MELRYRTLNVFTTAGDRLSGNPLCVVEDGSGLDSAQMQALARQFNLSETTFILPSKRAAPARRCSGPSIPTASMRRCLAAGGMCAGH